LFRVLLALGVQLLRSAVARIGLMLAQQPECGLTMAIDAIALKVIRIWRTLVPIHPEPAQILELLLERLLGRALAIGVVDAQDEGPAAMAREKPGEQPRSNVADMQRAGRTRRETRTNRHRSLPLNRR